MDLEEACIEQLKQFLRPSRHDHMVLRRPFGNIASEERYRDKVAMMISVVHNARATGLDLDVSAWCAEMLDDATAMLVLYDRGKYPFDRDFTNEVFGKPRPVVQHEFVRPLLRQTYHNAPLWLYEAIAIQAHRVLLNWDRDEMYAGYHLIDAAFYVLRHLAFDRSDPMRLPKPFNDDAVGPHGHNNVSDLALRYYILMRDDYSNRDVDVVDNELWEMSDDDQRQLYREKAQEPGGRIIFRIR